MTDVYSRIKAAVPEAKLYVAAPSPGAPGFADYVAAGARAARRSGALGLDAHAYGNPAEVEATLKVYRAHWQGPLLVTEHNFGAGRAYDLEGYAAELPESFAVAGRYGVEAMCVFIWDWANPDMRLPTSVSVKGSPAVYNAIKALTKKNRQVTDLASYKYGIATLASELGSEVTGEPLADEEYVGEHLSFQFSSKGVFVYDKKANTPHFLAATLPAK